MADLLSAFESLTFTNVRTYLQSGNVVFDTNAADVVKIVTTIEKKLRQKFGFEVPVVLRTPEDLARILRANPFSARSNADYLYVIFLSRPPDAKTVASLIMQKESAEEFKLVGREIFLYLPHGYGRTKLNNNAFEKKLSCAATTRNWKTVNALMAMAGN
jgi:uncharacterized protein (DUF1697 family)